LDRARSELAHAARITTLNALTASMAHEINQPLASLVTNASISFRRLNADPPNVDGARETLQRVLSASVHDLSAGRLISSSVA
jgi:C4-dicarboxylate-specific signal transduction histidine kinase